MLKLPPFPPIYPPEFPVADGVYDLVNRDGDRIANVKAIVENQRLVVEVPINVFVLETIFNHPKDGNNHYYISVGEDISDFYSGVSTKPNNLTA